MSTAGSPSSGTQLSNVVVEYHTEGVATEEASALYIDKTTGNVGINTTTPNHTLTVEGTSLITGAVQLSNYGLGAVQSDANGNLSVSSDERLKNVLGDFERGLQEILQIKPINYRWNTLSGLTKRVYIVGSRLKI